MSINLITNLTYPQNNENNIPIGSSIVLFFDKEVDINSIKECCILTGPDNDRTSGPDNAVWMLNNQNKDFLRSPGYSGFVDFEVELKYYDDTTSSEVSDVDDSDIVSSYYTMAVIKPNKALSVHCDYKLYLIGENTSNIGAFQPQNSITQRTHYSATLNNLITKRVKTKGTFSFINPLTLNIKIISSGLGSEARYLWWFSNEPVPSLNSERVTKCSTKYRSLDHGLTVSFENTQYTQNELYQIKCYPKENLQTSYLFNFRTGNEDVFVESDYNYTSTSPLDISVPTRLKRIETEPLRIISIDPDPGSVNISKDIKFITITFNKELNASSVNQNSIKIKSLPVSGNYQSHKDNTKTFELAKIVSVVENKIIIEL